MADARLRLHEVFDVSSEEKRWLWGKYSAEFKSLVREGDGKAQMKLATRIIFNLDAVEGESSGIALMLAEAKRRKLSEPHVARLLYVLSETDSDKAKDFVFRSIGQDGLKDKHYWLLIGKLIKKGVLSKSLNGFFAERTAGLKGDKLKTERKLLLHAMRLSIRELGIAPDAELLGYLMRNARDIAGLDRNLSKAREQKEKFEVIKDKDELARVLASDKEKGMLFFIYYGGRTRFVLVNNYDSRKFATAVKIASELRVHEGPLDEFINSLGNVDKNAIRGALLVGSFPLGGYYSSKVRVDVRDSVQLSAIERRAAGVFGKNELGVVLKLPFYLDKLEKTDVGMYKQLANCGGLADAAAVIEEIEKRHTSLMEKAEKALESNWRKLVEKKVLELSLHAVLDSEENWVSIKKFGPALEEQRKTLLNAVRQKYKSGSIDKLVRDEKITALEEKGWAELMVYLLKEVAMVTKREVEGRAFAEWESHLDQVLQDFQGIGVSEKKATSEKEVILRYLDKREDFVECLRFADSVQCCFNSKNYRLEGYNIGSAKWVLRIWKDPLSFIFQIESSPGNAIGFVLGSFGLAHGKPVVMYNGVYMEKKTDIAARSIMKQLEQDFSRPLRMSMQFVAARYGGTANYGAEYSNKRVEVKRLRAIRGRDGMPENLIYDDINVGVNTPGTTDEKVWHKKL